MSDKYTPTENDYQLTEEEKSSIWELDSGQRLVSDILNCQPNLEALLLKHRVQNPKVLRTGVYIVNDGVLHEWRHRLMYGYPIPEHRTVQPRAWVTELIPVYDINRNVHVDEKGNSIEAELRVYPVSLGEDEWR